MELKKIIKIYKKNILFILFFIVIFSVLSLVINNSLRNTYKASFSLNIVQQNEDKTKDFKYDNYYSFKAIEIFSNSLENWLNNPNIAQKALEKSDVNFNDDDLKGFFKVRRLSFSYLEVEFKSDNKEDIEKIRNSLVETINEELDKLKVDKQIWYKVSGTDAYIENAKYSNTILVITAIISGFLISSIIIFARYYLK